MRLHHIAFRTRDVDRLVRFYREVFQLVVVREERPRTVWLALDDAVLMIEHADESPPKSSEVIIFAVDELDTWRSRWEALGVKLDGWTPATLYVRDPEGRRVGVSMYPLSR